MPALAENISHCGNLRPWSLRASCNFSGCHKEGAAKGVFANVNERKQTARKRRQMQISRSLKGPNMQTNASRRATNAKKRKSRKCTPLSAPSFALAQEGASKIMIRSRKSPSKLPRDLLESPMNMPLIPRAVATWPAPGPSCRISTSCGPLAVDNLQGVQETSSHKMTTLYHLPSRRLGVHNQIHERRVGCPPLLTLPLNNCLRS